MTGEFPSILYVEMGGKAPLPNGLTVPNTDICVPTSKGKKIMKGDYSETSPLNWKETPDDAT